MTHSRVNYATPRKIPSRQLGEALLLPLERFQTRMPGCTRPQGRSSELLENLVPVTTEIMRTTMAQQRTNATTTTPRLCSWLSLLLTATLVCSATAQIPFIDKEQQQQQQQQLESPKCRLWLAPSQTSGSDQIVKFGLFAGVDYDENETLPLSEIAIPMIDFVEPYNRDTTLKDKILSFLEGFLWTAHFAGANWEGNLSSPVAIPGIGILANYHSGTYNVKWLEGATLLRKRTMEMPIPGQAHPARGAVTPYTNLTFRATQRIPAGMEIFANFGDVWDGNHTDDFYQDKLTRWDYMEADKILDKIVEFMNKYQDQLTSEQREKILDFMLDKILGTAGGKHAKVIRSLIPAHPAKLQKVKDMGGTFAYRNADMIKKQTWLQKYGSCLDTLRVGPSTIPEAGRGAFTTRKIAAGEVITLSPMLHIPNKELMHMYSIVDVLMSDGEHHLMYDRKRYLGQQLIVNYCFSHRETNMLLFPIGSLVTMINHKSNANAYITWSNHKYMPNEHTWHDKAPNELMLDQTPKDRLGIVMRVVASRDIQEGEEVFLDYGPDWARAWHAYSSKWVATYQNNNNNNSSTWPFKAMDMNELYLHTPFETNETLQSSSSPYPSGVATACFLETQEPEDGTPKKNAYGFEIASFLGPTRLEEYTGGILYQCHVQDRVATNDSFFYNYTVWAISAKGEATTEVRNVPHAAITFVDQPYTSDIHTPGAFRHWIGIIDQHFPQMWRDKR